MTVSEAKRLKALEDENAKLKRHLAEQMLDIAAMKELLSKMYGPPRYCKVFVGDGVNGGAKTDHRAATIKRYRHQIMRFGSYLANSGIAVETINSPQVVLDPGNEKQGLRQMLKRNDGVTNRDISQTAALLRNLARLTELPEDHRDALASLAKKVAQPAQNGVTDRSRARQRVLQDLRHKNRCKRLATALVDC